MVAKLERVFSAVVFKARQEAAYAGPAQTAAVPVRVLMRLEGPMGCLWDGSGHAQPAPEYFPDAVLAQIGLDPIAVTENTAVAGREVDGNPFLVLVVVFRAHHAPAAVADAHPLWHGFDLVHGPTPLT